MKALGILRNKTVILHPDIKSSNKVQYKEKDINMVIKELEDLQNRKCSNCKHWYSKKVDHPNYRECNSEETFNLRYEETYCDFCCNKWESKK